MRIHPYGTLVNEVGETGHQFLRFFLEAFLLTGIPVPFTIASSGYESKMRRAPETSFAAEPAAYTGDSRIDRLLLIIQAHYSAPDLSVKAASRSLNISGQHLGRVFKRHTGLSFRQYLRNLRIRRAAELLENSADEIKTVGGLVGYLDQSHFGQEFCKCMGTTPREFRVASRNAGPKERNA